MQWISHEHPKIDRIVCPWLIQRFIDPEAQFPYVPVDIGASGSARHPVC
jgi:hypothetical protein